MHRPPAIPISSLAISATLDKQRYSLDDLSRALGRYIDLQNRGQFTSRAERGMAEFKVNGVWPVIHPERIDAMQHAFNVMNDVFFNGYLTGLVELQMSEQPPNKPTRRGSCKLHTSRGPPYCVIEVHPNRIEPHGWRRAQIYQNVLIHEMLHAYFELYACDCGDGQGDDCKSALRRHRGHTLSWFMAARAIEHSTVNRRSEVASKNGPLAFRVYFRRLRIIAKAVDEEGVMPSGQMLDWLDFTMEDIREEQNEITKENAKNAKNATTVSSHRPSSHKPSNPKPHGSGRHGGPSRR